METWKKVSWGLIILFIVYCVTLPLRITSIPEPLAVEINYYPNRTVIKVDGVVSDYTRKAVKEIETKYNIEEIIDRGRPAGRGYFTKVTIIATPKDKDPNSIAP